MEKQILDEVNKLKKDMILSYTKYSISGGQKQSDEILLNTILCSFFETISTQDEFLTKYEMFIEEDKLIEKSQLFEVADAIYHSQEKNDDEIRGAISIYNRLIENEDYQRLSAKSGYQVPPDFGVEYAYRGVLLHERIEFYHLVKEKYAEIYRRVFKNGGVHR